jgi:hypothetical protein
MLSSKEKCFYLPFYISPKKSWLMSLLEHTCKYWPQAKKEKEKENNNNNEKCSKVNA